MLNVEEKKLWSKETKTETRWANEYLVFRNFLVTAVQTMKNDEFQYFAIYANKCYCDVIQWYLITLKNRDKNRFSSVNIQRTVTFQSHKISLAFKRFVFTCMFTLG